MLSILFLYAILASTFTVSKMLLAFVPPLFLIGMRMLFSGTVLLLGYYIFAKQKPKVTWSDALTLFIISIIHIFIPYATEFIALQTVAPSCAALLYNLSPFFSALFSYWYFHETMTAKKWLGAGISFSGLLYFIKPDVCVFNASSFNSAYLLLLIGIATSALAWVKIRQIIKGKQYSIVFINGVAMLLGGIESFAASSIYREVVDFPWNSLGLFLILFFAVVLCSNLFYNFYGYLLKRYTATFLSFMGLLTPLLAAFFDWLFLGQKIHTNFFITLVLITVGVYIFYQEELKQRYIIAA